MPPSVLERPATECPPAADGDFDVALAGEVHGCYDVSRALAEDDEAGRSAYIAPNDGRTSS